MGIPEFYLLPGKRSNLRRTQVLLLSQLFHTNSHQTYFPTENKHNSIKKPRKRYTKHPQPKCIQFALYERKKKNHNGSPGEAHTEKNIKHLSEMSHKKTQSEKGDMKNSPDIELRSKAGNGVYSGTRSGRISDLLGAMRGWSWAMKTIAVDADIC